MYTLSREWLNIITALFIIVLLIFKRMLFGIKRSPFAILLQSESVHHDDNIHQFTDRLLLCILLTVAFAFRNATFAKIRWYQQVLTRCERGKNEHRFHPSHVRQDHRSCNWGYDRNCATRRLRGEHIERNGKYNRGKGPHRQRRSQIPERHEQGQQDRVYPR